VYIVRICVPVDIDVEAPAKVMCNGVDGDIKYDGCENPVSADYGKIGLFLSAGTDLSLAVFAADVLANC
jgi:hypothetical protein